MIPFIKPKKPNIELFNRLLSDSIEHNHYTNFGPNEKRLREAFAELTGWPNNGTHEKNYRTQRRYADYSWREPFPITN